jgi:hypothetical protein
MKYLVAVIAFLAVAHCQDAIAQNVTKRTCVTDAYGTRTCTEYFGQRSGKPQRDRIMGMSTKKYIRGLREGKCMPSPSGACGGG